MESQQLVQPILLLHELSLKWLNIGHELSLSLTKSVNYLDVRPFRAVFFRTHPKRRNTTQVDQAHVKRAKTHIPTYHLLLLRFLCLCFRVIQVNSN